MSDREYLIVKRGFYYRPDRAGYTGVKADAGRYTRAEAEREPDTCFLHERHAPKFSPACTNEVKADALESPRRAGGRMTHWSRDPNSPQMQMLREAGFIEPTWVIVCRFCLKWFTIACMLALGWKAVGLLF